MDGQRVLLVAIDDNAENLEMIKSALEQRGWEIVTTTEPAKGLALVFERRPEIVLTDLKMPGMTGMEVLERIMEREPGIEVVLMTAHYSTESAVEAIRKGATDYLEKPLSVERLRQRIDGLIEAAQEKQRNLDLQLELLEANRFEGLVGSSPLKLEVLAKSQRVAPHFHPALFTGATGTGKE